MSTTSSKNFTTLYSGSGSVTPQAPYGNANVVGLLSVGTDGANTVANISATGAVNTTGTMSATGNIVTAGYFVGNFAGNITGNVSVPGSNTQVLFNNAGNIGTATGFTFNSAANVLATPGNITATGNVQGNYFLGNGSQLTGLPATYGNANVTTLLAAFGSNTISSTGNITTTANVSGGFILGNGSQLTGLPATYSNANVTSLLAAFGSNTISSTGNITTTANIAGAFFLGNGSQLTGLPASYSNANVTTLLAAFGSNTISTTGNVTAGNFIGNGQYLTNINAGNITGSYGDANVAAFMAAFGSNTITTTGNVITGNITAGNLQTTGALFTNGNSTYPSVVGGYLLGPAYADGDAGIFGKRFSNDTISYVIANGNSVGNSGYVDIRAATFGTTDVSTWRYDPSGNITLPGNTSAINYANGTSILAGAAASAGGSNTQIQYNNGGAFAGNSAMTFNNTTGNIGLGNLVVNVNNINTANTLTFTSAASNNPARVLIGNAVNGNSAVAMDFFNRNRNTRLSVWDYVARGDGNVPATETTFQQDIELTANIASNSTTRLTATQSILHIGGGSSAFQSLHPSAFAITGHQGGVWAGTLGNIAVGNTTIAGAAGFQAIIAANTGATIGNAVSMLAQPQFTGTGAQLTNITGFAAGPVALATPTTLPTNYYAFYNPGLTGTVGVSTPAAFRQATNYYAFRNDDDVAQIKLGSLRAYHEYQYSTATTGTVNIDKSNSQVQYLAPTANVTIGSFQNFVTTATDAVTADNQADTVTLLIRQGATPYTVTMPTGNASIKYAGNVSTIGSTANSVSMVSITGANIAGAAMYLVTVSPEFV